MDSVLLSGALSIIYLDRIASNFRAIKNYLGDSTFIAPVVKSDCYGLDPHYRHVIQVLAKAGANTYCAGHISDAIKLRKTNSANNARIFILYPVNIENLKYCIDYNLIVPISSISDIENIIQFNANSPFQKITDVHLSFDTGMNRAGLSIGDLSIIESKMHSAGLYPIMIMSHPCYSYGQDGYFNAYKAFIGINIFPNAYRSFMTSSALFREPRIDSDIARIGNALYSGFNCGNATYGKIRNVFSVYARILSYKYVYAGETISYDATYKLERDSVIGVINAGYCNGLVHGMANTHKVFYKGKLCKVLGKVCMDTCMIDLTGISPEKICAGDFVEIIGDNVNVLLLEGNSNTVPTNLLSAINLNSYRLYCESNSLPNSIRNIIDSII